MDGAVNENKKEILVIVAHPDDETLWCGGTVLNFPEANRFIACLSRKNDLDRAPKFRSALKQLKADGIMGDLDDGPEQVPLRPKDVEKFVLNLIPHKYFDLIITHDPSGEYTRHLRHEEIGAAVIKLWHGNKIATRELWTFAYEDSNKAYFPKNRKEAPIQNILSESIFKMKSKIINEVYGFLPDSFESQCNPKAEAFWKFTKTQQALKWLQDAKRSLKNKL
ncbi:GlcNAc-PI de-N-acetylase [Leeuwenhoekiella aestuarii]|uniref:GlcNAc-PI de-N-acetylase n=1 Tax=Leeuwenhoekiella aestuarii TaxID=2249426 RepID=A0A4Q0NTY3_9FLAO|nr:PIG-L family deacetylase [Leeuwenhoekiella aestuarii]RXG11658.1 GlcNAc-PI de-N-acetylase [Leeuwenhoekiella aestuarii]RXG15131.1 GlcNAc-PI de-N-acetylase [Leeuwenhoekiella aestuarii]